MSKAKDKPMIQTRLSFSVLPHTARSKDQSPDSATPDTSIQASEKQSGSEYDLSKDVGKLSVQSKPSKQITATKPHCHQRRHHDNYQGDMIRCTAITKGDQQCDLCFCVKCLADHYNESAEEVGHTQSAEFTGQGRKINHVAGKQVTWACPKCRDICTCKACSKAREERQNSGSRSIMQSFVQQKDANATMKPLIALQPKPPKLSNLELKFSEEVIWQRLQVREFVFRFEHLLALSAEDRNLLQDTQGDWVTHRMLKKLVCSLMELIAHYGVENDSDQQKMAKHFLQDEHVASSRPYLSLHHWQAISAILMDAGYEDTPVFNEVEAIAESDAQQQMDWLPSFVTRSMQAKGTGPMPIMKDALNELITINLLSMCTLYTPCIRKDLLQGSVQLKDEEEALHTLRRQTMSDDMHARTTKNTLLQQLATAEERGAIQQQIEDVDTQCEERHHLLNRKEVDVYLLSRKTSKRLSSAGTDQHGNQYWLFGDLHHNQEYQDQDFWGRGVIIIGPGCQQDKQQSDHSEGNSNDESDHKSPCVAMLTANNRKRWWYLSGIENIDTLVQWLNYYSEPKQLIRQLSSRSRYLNHLFNR